MQATGINATISLAPADAGHFTFTADTVKATFGSYLELDAIASANQPAVAFDTAAADGYIAQIGTLEVKFSLGGFTIGGSASNFDILPNGMLDTSQDFGVSLNVNDPNATAKTFQLPSWLPFSISKLDLTWPDISHDPADFSIDLSASVGGTLGPVTLSGSVQDAVIDVGKLEQGEFPIDSLGGVGISVGGTCSAARSAARSSLPTRWWAARPSSTAASRPGLISRGSPASRSASDISQYGPLDAYVEVNAPIILDPDSGLAVTNLYGEVLFDDPLNSDRPADHQRRGAAEQRRVHQAQNQTLQQWETELGQQVMNQASSSNPWDPFNQPVTIKAGATLFDAYATSNAFELDGNLVLCTNGILEASGVLTVGDSISLTGAAYIDLSKVASGQAALDFAVEAPSQAPLATIYGGIEFQYAAAPTLLNSGPGSSPPRPAPASRSTAAARPTTPPRRTSTSTTPPTRSNSGLAATIPAAPRRSSARMTPRSVRTSTSASMRTTTWSFRRAAPR